MKDDKNVWYQFPYFSNLRVKGVTFALHVICPIRVQYFPYNCPWQTNATANVPAALLTEHNSNIIQPFHVNIERLLSNVINRMIFSTSKIKTRGQFSRVKKAVGSCRHRSAINFVSFGVRFAGLKRFQRSRHLWRNGRTLCAVDKQERRIVQTCLIRARRNVGISWSVELTGIAEHAVTEVLHLLRSPQSPSNCFAWCFHGSVFGYFVRNGADGETFNLWVGKIDLGL